MNVSWNYGMPETDGQSGMSKQLVVLTNLGYLNVGYFSSRTNRWSLEGLTMRSEFVVAYLDGLVVDERERT